VADKFVAVDWVLAKRNERRRVQADSETSQNGGRGDANETVDRVPPCIRNQSDEIELRQSRPFEAC